MFKCDRVNLSREKREDDVLGRRVSVVDTPGLFSTHLSEEKVKSELEEAVDLCSPGPHVFLLTIQLGPFTEQEQKGLKTLQKMLSPDVPEHTVVPFTYGDRPGDTDTDQFIREDQNLQELLRKCSGQNQVLNHRDLRTRDQVRELLQKIDSVSEGGPRFYQITRSSWSVRSVWSLIRTHFRRICSFLLLMSFGCIMFRLSSSENNEKRGGNKWIHRGKTRKERNVSETSERV
uniref:AIG1-type G domain-containing protein n=1 Tax=Anabas testudineus TaxID=64144 RepID=A0AAQ6IKH5_ANATE